MRHIFRKYSQVSQRPRSHKFLMHIRLPGQPLYVWIPADAYKPLASLVARIPEALHNSQHPKHRAVRLHEIPTRRPQGAYVTGLQQFIYRDGDKSPGRHRVINTFTGSGSDHSCGIAGEHHIAAVVPTPQRFHGDGRTLAADRLHTPSPLCVPSQQCDNPALDGIQDRSMSDATAPALSRRRLFELIGASAGGTATYQAMTRLGFAAESPYRGPIKLDGDPKGASVIILGAGLAGMTAAMNSGAPAIRVKSSNTTPARAVGTGRFAAGTSIPSSAARPSIASSTRGSISIRGRGAFPIIITRFWIIAADSASRSNPSSNSITTPICIPTNASTASRSASARSKPISKAASPSF